MRTRPYAKAVATNANSANFTAKTAAVNVKPSGNLILPVSDSQFGIVPEFIRLWPYGLGSNNDVFSLRVWGWRRLGPSLWIPSMLGEFSCTLSAFAGLAGEAVLSTELFCDTISIVANVGEATYTANTTRTGTAMLYSPQNDTPGWVEIDIGGVELLEFDFDQTTNTPTMNALYAYRDPYMS